MSSYPFLGSSFTQTLCSNIAEQLIEKGLATALRHKRDDENRSPDYDKLTTAEQAATADARGVHSGKNIPLPRIGNASEVILLSSCVYSRSSTPIFLIVTIERRQSHPVPQLVQATW